MKTDNHTFGQAIEAAKQGKLISRGASPGTVIFMQVPSQVPADIIPRMTSLPTSVKELARLRGVPLQYADQFAAIDEQNYIKGWTPSTSDLTAQDWVITHHVEASDTVGTATPLKSGCNNALMRQGKPYPRTCADCGLLLGNLPRACMGRTPTTAQ